MTIKEIKGDLFSVYGRYPLVHCISADAKMGAGIAVEFSKKFPKMRQEVIDEKMEIGDSRLHQNGEACAYTLVTKQKYYDKPTNETLRKALESLERNCTKCWGFETLAMPRIGCGLDKLDWNEVKKIIEEVFESSGIEILIFYK